MEPMGWAAALAVGSVAFSICAVLIAMCWFGMKSDYAEFDRQERWELAAEIDRLRQDCAQAYQVIGAGMFGEPCEYTQDDVERALDNLNAAANGEPRPHDDLIPWPMDRPDSIHCVNVTIDESNRDFAVNLGKKLAKRANEARNV